MPLFSRCSLLFLFLVLIPGASSAIPITITGIGDSLTCNGCNDGSYLGWLPSLLWQPGSVIEDLGKYNNNTSQIHHTLEHWIDDGNFTNLMIITAGTVDVSSNSYNAVNTIANVVAMVKLLEGKNIETLLVSSPLVGQNCNSQASCDTMNARLAQHSAAMWQVAQDNGVAFVDLYAAFLADNRIGLPQDDPDSLFYLPTDGVHLKYSTGDMLFASTIAPTVNHLLWGDWADDSSQAATNPVPEPSSTALFALNALIGTLALRRSRRNSRPRSA